MVDARISVGRLTDWLLPGFVELFEPDDKVTLVTSLMSFPLLAFNVTRDVIIRPVRWRLWFATIVPILLLMPPVRQIGRWLDIPFLELALLFAALLLTLALDLAIDGIAARLRRDREEEAAYPRAEAPRYAARINFTVMEGPEPDWHQRLLDRWNGDFDDGYRHDLGLLALANGRVLIGEPGDLDRAAVVPVPPGTHQVWLAVARKETDERVSHAFLAVAAGTAAKIVPVAGAEGVPIRIDVDGGLAAFASLKAAASLAAASGAGVEQDYMIVKAMMEARADWLRFAVPNSEDVVATFTAGYGDGTYPLVTLRDERDAILAVAIDFKVW